MLITVGAGEEQQPKDMNILCYCSMQQGQVEDCVLFCSVVSLCLSGLLCSGFLGAIFGRLAGGHTVGLLQ
jgi:hypothetical protein